MKHQSNESRLPYPAFLRVPAFVLRSRHPLASLCLTWAALMAPYAAQASGALDAVPGSRAGVSDSGSVDASIDPTNSAALIDTLQKQIQAQQALLQALQDRMNGTPVATAGKLAGSEDGGADARPATDTQSGSAGGGVVARDGSGAHGADSSSTASLPLEGATVVSPPVQVAEPAASAAAGNPAAPSVSAGSGSAPASSSSASVAPSGSGAGAGAAPATHSVTVTGLPDGENMTTAQRQAYASGVSVWREIENSMNAQRSLGINLDPQYVMLGLKDMATRSPLKMSRDAIDNVTMTLNQLYMQKSQEIRDLQKTQGAAYRIAFSKQKGSKSDAGSWYQVVNRGTGKSLRTTDVVTLSVTGTLPDGTVFDASGQNGQVKTAKVGALLPAVAIGLQKVAPGGHIKIVVPPEKGYGDAGLQPAIPGGATLIFDIEVQGLAGGGAR